MIACDFDYYLPTSLTEAVDTFRHLYEQGKRPLYYAGGTEIISLARVNRIVTHAVIDIKAIPECQVLKLENNRLVIGAAVTLSQLEEADFFPLLTATSRRLADHTSRNKITVGGNICGSMMYREIVLPFLLTDSEAVIAGVSGLKQVPLRQVFDQTLHLQAEELLVQLVIDARYTALPYVSIKKTQLEKIDYPLLTVAALMTNDQQIRMAFSGVCAFPFRSTEIEAVLNESNTSLEPKVDHALERLPASVLDDIQGSAEYREFVLRNTLIQSITTLEGGASCP